MAKENSHLCTIIGQQNIIWFLVFLGFRIQGILVICFFSIPLLSPYEPNDLQSKVNDRCSNANTIPGQVFTEFNTPKVSLLFMELFHQRFAWVNVNSQRQRKQSKKLNFWSIKNLISRTQLMVWLDIHCSVSLVI